MNGYVPHDLRTTALAGGLLAAILCAGLLVTRLPPRWYARLLAWALAVGGTAAVERLCAGEPAGVPRMLAVIGALLFGMKAVVGVESQAGGEARLTAWQWLLFAALWPGMRPDIFRGLGGPPRDARPLLLQGAAHLLLGSALIALAACVWHLRRSEVSENDATVRATLLLLPGVSLALHFGVFNLVAGPWRRAGVDARSLFRSPLLARSLGEFWGRRWNLAFSEMTAIGVYRPLSGVFGRTAGVAGAFFCSGLLHEVAISLPVLCGFGLPSLYFVLHGTLVLIERALERRGVGVATWGWLARVWVLAWLALPAPILFHVPFLRGCVWPLIGM